MRRYIVEFGIGMDFHGQDVSKAAAKAVRDATTKSCLCGLQ
ncbi:MAG: Lin0512 family protein, partial [Synergistaceae bacterium]|nr:Lin0512 family protein [Synergistaceae bacterium]